MRENAKKMYFSVNTYLILKRSSEKNSKIGEHFVIILPKLTYLHNNDVMIVSHINPNPYSKHISNVGRPSFLQMLMSVVSSKSTQPVEKSVPECGRGGSGMPCGASVPVAGSPDPKPCLSQLKRYIILKKKGHCRHRKSPSQHDHHESPRVVASKISAEPSSPSIYQVGV